MSGALQERNRPQQRLLPIRDREDESISSRGQSRLADPDVEYAKRYNLKS
jgi:hypothetical protein